jgi:hypothetical protein
MESDTLFSALALGRAVSEFGISAAVLRFMDGRMR